MLKRTYFAPEIIPKEVQLYKTKLFLAGSIEMGRAELWQDRLTNILTENTGYVFLNPRRNDWDSSWVQDISNKQFVEQVEWELSCLEMADDIVIYFDPNTMSPISLLELGIHSTTGKVVVCCPKGFWRKGNVDVVCRRYMIPLVETIDDLAETMIDKYKKRVLNGLDDAFSTLGNK